MAGQEPSPGLTRQLVRETGLPPIDRGLRDQDLPGDPAERPPMPQAVDRSGVDASPFLPGSVIVKFKGGADRSAAVSSALAQVEGAGANRPSWANFDIVDLPTGANPEHVAADLSARADVEYAQARFLNHAMYRPNDPLYANQWNFPAIDMERAWDIQPGATSDIIVAVLDTGVAFRAGTFRYNSRFAFRLSATGPVYPALGIVDVPFAAAPELGDPSRFVSPRDFIWEDNDPVDLGGHGTHVSGTIGQLTNNNVGVAGMAFNVRLMPVKVIAETWDLIFGAPNGGSDDILARGIRYAADNGAKVINMSVGREDGGPSPVVDDAIRYAVGRGVFVAIASGNTREQGNQPNIIGNIAPTLAGAVTVGAVGRSLETAFYSATSSAVELSAPGGDTRQAGGSAGGILQQTLDLDLVETFTRPPAQFGPPRADSFAYNYFQGTSMATPHVSGFAALLMQQGLTSPAVIEEAMKTYATDKGPPGRDDEYGAGLINPRATLRGLGLAR
ncbi:MAG TPA: S8 family serine peptidase [Vicinamibacterales bacterium]|nr:S8 family serine peptidase [Vicinamibacterales bacterium]